MWTVEGEESLKPRVPGSLSTDVPWMEKKVEDTEMAEPKHDDSTQDSDAPPLLVPIQRTNEEPADREIKQQAKVVQTSDHDKQELTSPTKNEQKLENLVQQYKKRFAENDPMVLFEMFETTLRKVLTVQKNMIEVKKGQASLKTQLEAFPSRNIRRPVGRCPQILISCRKKTRNSLQQLRRSVPILSIWQEG